jgi:hypothetical protein
VGTHAALVVEMATAASSRSAAAAPEQQRLTERDMRLKSRLAERVTDPTRFNRRVPDEFYETEEELGPLPEGWEKAFKGRQTYFVNHKTKETTWVDPRTEKTREHDITKIKPNELPYGWDEAIDDYIGVYYIDHNTRTTFLDPPWDELIMFQVSQLQAFLRDQQRQAEALQQRLDDDDAIEKARARVAELEARRILLEKELNRLQSQAMDTESVAESISDIESQLSDLEDEEAIQRMIENGSIFDELAKFKARLAELTALNERLRNNAGADELANAKASMAEMDRLRDELDREAADRKRLEAEIMSLKGEMEKLYGETSTVSAPAPAPASDERDSFQGLPVKRKTKYEMEIELLMLKKRIEAERVEKERLARLKSSMENFRDGERVGALPEWIKKIEEVAANSKTLRIKIGRKQAQNPDLLSFRERMLFFTSGAVESNIKGSALPMPDKKPPQFRNAVVPRETAAVAANKPKAAVQAAGYVRR